VKPVNTIYMINRSFVYSFTEANKTTTAQPVHLVYVVRHPDVCTVKTAQRPFANRSWADVACTRSPILPHLSVPACTGKPATVTRQAH